MLKDRSIQKYNHNIFIFVFNVLALSPLLIFGGSNYSIDSCSILLDYNVHLNNFISGYRYFGAFLYKIIVALGYNPVVDSTADSVFYIIVAALAVTLLAKAFYNNLKDKDILSLFVVDLAVIVSVANVWLCDILSFPECVTITGVGLFLCVAAVCVIDKKQSLLRCLISVVLLVLSTAIYQQFISMFTVFAVALFGLKAYNKKDFKALINNYIKPAAVVFVSGISYFVIGKFVLADSGLQENSRIALSLQQVVDNVVYFATHQHSYLKGRGFFSTELLTVLFLLIGLLWFACVMVDWLKNRKHIRTLFLLISYAVAYLGTDLCGILSLSHAARAMFPLFSVFALFTMGILAFNNKKIIKTAVLLIVVIALSMNMIKIVEREALLKQQNAEDFLWASQVVYEIEKYEKENGITITAIELCDDAKTSPGYGESIRNVSYARKAILTLSSGRDFSYKAMSDDKYKEYFKNKDWSVFDAQEQMIFEGDTLYLCCY